MSVVREGAPEVFEVSRPRLVVRVLVLLVLATLALLSWLWLQLRTTPTLLAGVGVAQAWWLLRDGYGRTEVTAAGVRIRALRGGRTFVLTDVRDVQVVRTVFGRHTRLFAAGKTTRLVAPMSSWLLRDRRFEQRVAALRAWFPGARSTPVEVAMPKLAAVGLAVLAVAAIALDRPLGWVGGAEADVLPDPCAVAITEIAGVAALADVEPQPPLTETDQRICTRVGTGNLRLVIGYRLFERSGAHSATSVASDAGLEAGLAGVAPILDAPRLGDASRTYQYANLLYGKQPLGVMVVARRANVQVRVYYGVNPRSPASSQTPLRSEEMRQPLTVAEAAVAAVRLHA